VSTDSFQSGKKAKAAVIFHRLGPYHWARLEAAARQREILAIEAFAEQLTYPWECISAPASFERVTLFDGSASISHNRQLRGRLFDCLDRFQPGMVLIPGWGNLEALVALAWCTSRRVPAIVMSESTAWDERRFWWKEGIKRRLVALYSCALVGGHPHADYLVQLGMSPDRVFHGYDAVDNDYFAQKAEQIRSHDTVSRIERGLPQNYFLASARFIEKKNLTRLLQAYSRYLELWGEPGNKGAELAPTVPWSLVLLGDGPLRKTLETQLAALQLRDRVLLPGFKQYADLPAYYASAGAFIHASSVEQWGLVVNEAMASGLPVLVSNRCGCASDLVQEGKNGFTFDPYDIEQLVSLMLQMSRMETQTRKAMGRESERIIADWGPSRFADGLNGAAHRALEAALPRAGWLDRLLLQGLLLQ
jgi:1,2-diacylglycerol 3-alpha-glucosyltransferase